MKRRWIIPLWVILLLLPTLACETVLRALRPQLPLPPELSTSLPPLLEGTLPAELPPELATGLPPEVATALPGFMTAEPPPDIPVVDRPKDLVGTAFLVSYSTSLSFDEVVKFYQEQMPLNGWEEAESPSVVEGFAVLSYAKDGRTAAVTISGGQGDTTVIVAIGNR